MNVLRTIARIVLGAFFIVMALLVFMPQQQMPGMIGLVSHALYVSHWDWFIAAAQIVAGVLLVINRFTGFALIVIGAFLYNSFAFHITTSPQFLPMPLLVTIVWAFVAWPLRAGYARLFTERITTGAT